MTVPGGAIGDYFGASVAIAGSTAVVGVYGVSYEAGVAYVFVRSDGTWSQQAELTASNSAPGAQFGASVALAGPTAVIGAPTKNSSTGTAYVFVGM